MQKEPPKTKIQFKTIHEGMGFHPFSDGLPYAPASKAPTSTGTGATAAGKPHFVTGTQTRPQTNTYYRPATTGSLHTQLNLNPAETLAATPRAATALNPPNLATETQILRRRAFAYLLDMVVHAGFWLLTNLAVLFFFNYQIEPAIFTENLPSFVGFFILSQWLFIALQEMLFETTLGKAFFNLEFKRNHRSLLLRSMVFMLGVAFLGLGFIYRPQDKLGQIALKSKIES